jgi:hypothetical protein
MLRHPKRADVLTDRSVAAVVNVVVVVAVASAASVFSVVVHSNRSGADQCLTRDHGAVITLMHILLESGIRATAKQRRFRLET